MSPESLLLGVGLERLAQVGNLHGVPQLVPESDRPLKLAAVVVDPSGPIVLELERVQPNRLLQGDPERHLIRNPRLLLAFQLHLPVRFDEESSPR